MRKKTDWRVVAFQQLSVCWLFRECQMRGGLGSARAVTALFPRCELWDCVTVLLVLLACFTLRCACRCCRAMMEAVVKGAAAALPHGAREVGKQA